jgi:hypothetical protein
MRAPPPYPGLTQLCNAYLHEGFEADSGSWHDAVRKFMTLESPALVEQARAEAAALMNRRLSERDLTDLFRAIGSRYWPAGDGTSFGIWVRELAVLLRAQPDSGNA